MRQGSVAYTNDRGVFYHPPRASPSAPATSASVHKSHDGVTALADPFDGIRRGYPAAPTANVPTATTTNDRRPVHHTVHHALSRASQLSAPISAYSPVAQYLMQDPHQQPQPPLMTASAPRYTSSMPQTLPAAAQGKPHPQGAFATRTATLAEEAKTHSQCWLCGIACPQGPGSWGTASDDLQRPPLALFYGPCGPVAVMTAAAADPDEEASSRQQLRAWWLRDRLWVSGLALCDVCGRALSIDVRASSEEVLQRARHTPVLSQHRLSFVNALREYKLLQEMIAERVLRAAQRFRATVASRAQAASPAEAVSTACMTADTSLWETPRAIQKKVLHQLTQALEDTLAADDEAKAELGRGGGVGQRWIPLTAPERHALLEEITHLERQAQRMAKGEYARLKALHGPQGIGSSVSRSRPSQAATARVRGLELAADDFLDTSATAGDPSTEGATAPQQVSVPAPAAGAAESRPDTFAVPPSATAKGTSPSMTSRVEATFWAAHHRHPSPPLRGVSADDGGVHTPGRLTSATQASSRAPLSLAAGQPRDASPSPDATKCIDPRVGRGAGAGADASGDSGVARQNGAASAAVTRANAASGLDTRTILARYFEGVDDTLPETISLLPKEEAMACAVADTTARSLNGLREDLAGQNRLPTTEDMLLPREGSAAHNRPGELVLCPPETTTVEALLRAVLASEHEADTTAEGRERRDQLAKSLHVYLSHAVQARHASEDALLAAHGKVARLMKSANHMSESLLTHSLSFTFRAHLQAIETLVSRRMNMMQLYCLQKSVLFSEEMTTLVRLAQRRAYRVAPPVMSSLKASPPRDGGAYAKDAARVERKDNEVREEEEEMTAPNPQAARTAICSATDSRHRRHTSPFTSAAAPESRAVAPSNELQNFLEPHLPPGTDYQDWDFDDDGEDEVDARALTKTRPSYHENFKR